MSGSTLYTIGTALSRACDNDVPVQLLVEGEWIAGKVVVVDGFGVVLSSGDLEHWVVRIESVSAVRIFTEGPLRSSITTGARSMPGPTLAYQA